MAALRARLGASAAATPSTDLAKQVAAGKLDPYTAADQLTDGL